jgi:hypothetical protein
MFTTDQFVIHLLGDYVVGQSDWMATEKKSHSFPCLMHAFCYTACFLLLTRNWLALFLIGTTHFIIDRTGIMKRLVYAKNWLLCPIWVAKLLNLIICQKSEVLSFSESYIKSWQECKTTGTDPDRPIWLAVWLLIIFDNIFHILINGLVLYYVK